VGSTGAGGQRPRLGRRTHPGTEVGEAIALALEPVVPRRCCPQIYKIGMPTVMFGSDPRTHPSLAESRGRAVSPSQTTATDNPF
jgi:hypothetical protein